MMNQNEIDVAEPDLTPMLDVVFILLIFFIVTATFVKETGIDVPSDDSSREIVNAKQSLVVEITRNNRFYVNKRHVDKRALLSYLSALHAEKPDASMVIVPDNVAMSDSLVFALDLGRILGVKTSISPKAS